jgi:signal transduction histidine kinase/DNA-binding response OmpR family regulator
MVLVLGVVLVSLVYVRRDSEIEQARRNFRAEASATTDKVALAFEKNFDQIYRALRTISRLPGVRDIDRHAKNFDKNAHQTLQEIYNNLAEQIEISEVYILPADFNPERLDPVTGALEAPIIMFDHLIVGRDADSDRVKDQEEERAPATTAEAEAEEEIEIHEYRLMRQQLDLLQKAAPRQDSFEALRYPGIISREVVTCDNRYFSPSNPDDRARSGIIYSVPFYGPKGEFKGMISAIVLTRAIEKWLPSSGFAWNRESHSYRGGDPAVLAGQAGTRIYEEQRSLRLTALDGGWKLSAGRPNSEFWARADVRSAQDAAGVSLILVAALVAALFVTLAIQRRNYELVVDREAELDQLVAQRTEELQSATDAAKAAVRAKSDFLAMMSHEIRTPMNGVLGMTSVLLDGALNAEQQRAATTIRESGENLLRIINDILDFSKLDASAMQIELSAFDLHSLLVSAGEMVGPRLASSGVKFALSLDPGLPQFVKSDAGRIRQIVLNFLANAAKFTAAGCIELKASVRQADNGYLLKVAVTDTGIGIPPDRLPMLFKSFEQADATISRRFGGTGLGLAISKRLAELLGGKVGAESEVGVGSTFWVEIPVSNASGEAVLAAQRHASEEAMRIAVAQIRALGRPLRLLLVEDNSTNVLVAKSVLIKFGISPDVAGSGLEALEAMRRGDNAYDLILMDVHMPEMDGIEATRAIRTMQGAQARTPIVALTANALSEDVQRCREAGMNGYVVKPFRKEDLLIAMAAALAGDASFEAPSAARAQEPASDDLNWETLDAFRKGSDEETLQLLIDTYLTSAGEALARLGVIGREVRHGAEAVRLAHSLKSSSAMAGAERLSALSAALEAKLSRQGDMTEQELKAMNESFAAYRDKLRQRGIEAA